MASRGQLYVGTSGWVYKHWLDIFYPRSLPASDQLRFYAEHFSTVEVNFSFYRLPPRSVFAQWRSEAPPTFLFAVKGSRYLTHMKKLNDPEEPLQRLMEHAGGLEEKLGPILFQFPRGWHVNLERLQYFVSLLRAYPGQGFAFEFRHASWLTPDIFGTLEDAGAALCLPVGPGVPLHIRLTANWTYIRMHAGQHGTGFSDAELQDWAVRIRSYLDRGDDVYIYFNNDPEGHAIRDAKDLLQIAP
jgi:uncharacterized protein YecE (DUF72 family)